MLTGYPADLYEIWTRTQEEDGRLMPPDERPGWVLAGFCAAEDKTAAIVIAAWVRPKKESDAVDVTPP